MYRGCHRPNEAKVRAYCSASDHLIRKIFSGVCRDSQWFEEYLTIIKIDVNFSNERSFFAYFTPLIYNMPGSHPLSATFIWPIEIQVHCENQSSSISRTRDIQRNGLCSSLIMWIPEMR